MNLAQACGVVARQRHPDSILVATMGAMQAFDQLEAAQGMPSGSASRISSVPLMGGAAGLGLGLACSPAQRPVIVVDGDASLLLELSGLVTVARAAPTRFLHVVIHNGTQFTGLSNLESPAAGFDFVGAARVAGYAHAERLADVDVWEQRFSALAAKQGPVLVELVVESAPARAQPGFAQTEMPDRQFERMGHETARLRDWLHASASTR